MSPKSSLAILLALSAGSAALPAVTYAQAVSVNGGSIQGTITDSTGAVISGATVIISAPDTGYTHKLTTDKAGFYNLGPLNPGSYTILVTSAGFEKLNVTTVVQTGTVTSGNEKLTPGQNTETVEVEAGSVQVNTEQIGVTGVITQQQIETLPVNGRNILDFAQLQPGVQLQAGGSGDGGFDPTKAGYSALSFNGISGRTTRILLDGQDVTDETVGTTIFNVSQGSVGELEISRATGDVSGDITSSGSVLASTRSGTNAIHGQLFYNFQDQRAGAATFEGAPDPFQRNQFGGEVGGPLIKDKLFFFANSERLKQDQSAGISLPSEFATIQTDFPNVASPDRDTYSTGRLDFNGPRGIHLFARVNYEANSYATGQVYSTYSNRDNADGVASGADYARGKFTHSIRGSYEKFHNLIGDTTGTSTSIYNPIPGYGIETFDGLETGPNPNAPQQTFQSDKQLRYDGTWSKGAHQVRFGGSLNRIEGGGLAAFFGFGPLAVIGSPTVLTTCPGVAAGTPCADDPSNGYSPYYIQISNDLGYASEKPGFGLPGGALEDWRTGFYLTDSWKIRPSFTLSFGARYDRDTGRTNSDLAAIPCSSIITANFAPGSEPCTGTSELLNQWGPNLGGQVAQPNRNVAPQLGFTYAPAVLSDKTVFRGGIGLFYESNVFNNVQFDRASRLPTGLFASYPTICNGSYTFPIAGKGLVTETSTGVSIQTICGESIAAGAAATLQLQADARAAGPVAGQNTSFVGYGLAIQNGSIAYGQNYRSPYSINVNFGFQQQLMKGMVLSADFIHLGTFRIQQTVDENHVGDSRYFSLTNAQAAVARTLAPNVSTGYAGYPMCPQGYSQASIDCAIANGALISDFATNGLDSGRGASGGYPGSFSGVASAFPGINQAVGVGTFSLPQGKAGYSGLQLNLRHQASHPVPGILHSNFESSYAYSSFVTSTGANGISTSDPFFSPPSYNNREPGTVLGPAGLDRRHIFSFGGSVDVKYGLKLGLITHLESAVPTNLTVDTQGGAPGEIFRSDFDGDGQTGDLVPGTEPGAYMRQVKPGGLNKLIAGYNGAHAGMLTPAGQVLVGSGLFTAQELTLGNGVSPMLAPAPSNPFANSMLKTLDVNASYPIRLNRVREGLSIEPGVAMYNVANFANYGGPTGSIQTAADLAASGTGGQGSVNGVSGFQTSNLDRVSRKTGTFDQGAPRSTEFQLRVNF